MSHTSTIGNITSANATLVLTVADLYPSGIGLEQFATDQSFSQEAVIMVEDRMGVDGQLVAGYVPGIKTVTVMLEASSPSYEPLADIYRNMDEKMTVFECTLTAHLPALGKTVTWSKGVMKSGTTVPAGKRVLDPTTWVFDFAKVSIAKN